MNNLFWRDSLAVLADFRVINLYLGENELTDLTPLSRSVQLLYLDLAGNQITDISPLAGLVDLYWLDLSSNHISEVAPLAGLTTLEYLWLDSNRIADVSLLAGLTALEHLGVGDNGIQDIEPLSELFALKTLFLDRNRIADIAPLVGLKNLKTLLLHDNDIANIGALAGLVGISQLYLSRNRIKDLSALALLTQLDALALDYNRVSDIRPLAGLEALTWLSLNGNRIDNVSVFANMARLRVLQLYDNDISNIEPLLGLGALTYVWLSSNPLDDISIDEHIPALQSRGIDVYFVADAPRLADPVPIADPTLRALIAEAATDWTHVDDPLPEWQFDRIVTLRLNGRGVRSLTGLENAESLRGLHAASNQIFDLSPLAGLANLCGADLRDNRISDLSVLVDNANLAGGCWVALGGNPLSERSLNVQVPRLLERGVQVSVNPVLLSVAVGGAPLRLDTTGYFGATLGAGVTTSVQVDDRSVVTVEAADGQLVVEPGSGAGTATATVTAKGGGATETLEFLVTVRGALSVPLVPNASDPVRQGFVRIINHDGEAGEVRIVAIDDVGQPGNPVTLAIGGYEAVHLNAGDLERGNAAKGLDRGTGPGMGDWRLEASSELDIEALGYVRTADGFLTAMQDVAATDGSVHWVPTFNPASNVNQVSKLRLTNAGAEPLEVAITGIDDAGESPDDGVALDIPGGATVVLTASELERGGAGLRGRLGDGQGKWRLRVSSGGSLVVMSLLQSPEGHLVNLSGGAPAALSAAGVHRVPLFPSASDPLGWQGFVRIVNRSVRSGVVRIQPHDDVGQRHEPLTLTLGAGQTVHVNSHDLELGNAAKGLSGSAGPGRGDWRLDISSDLDIDVLTYVRTPAGFLSTMHEVVAGVGRRYEVATFNPASNARQASTLRIVNPGLRPAHVSIGGVDDSGKPAGDVARFTVDAGTAGWVTPQALETGAGLRGALGDGAGKWRLVVDSEQSVLVMSLLESPTGHLANLSGIRKEDIAHVDR